MRFQTLLWDMDGTLFNTYPPIRRAVQATFASFGVHVDLETITHLMAISYSECVSRLCARHHLDEDAGRAAYFARSAQLDISTQPPYPGVVALCRRVVDAGGTNLIFTHRDRESLDCFLDGYAVRDLFADLLTPYDGYPRKPDPAGFLALLERNTIDPQDVLAIGDRLLDIQAGIAAGVKTCFFAPPDGPQVALLPDARPDYTISAYAELEELLFRQETYQPGEHPQN